MVNFEEYLASKKIDSDAFRKAEEKIWTSWKEELEQMHPNSFTVQKLNLINPIRRKYPLKGEPKLPQQPGPPKPQTSVDPVKAKPATPKPVFKPKPKIN